MNKPSEAVVLMEVTFWERKNQTGEVSCLIGAERELNRVRRERESGAEGKSGQVGRESLQERACELGGQPWEGQKEGGSARTEVPGCKGPGQGPGGRLTALRPRGMWER